MDKKRTLLEQRRSKADGLRDQGLPLYGNTFRPTHLAGDLKEAHGSLTEEELEGAGIGVTVAGRMMTARHMGKVAFAHLRDSSGDIQVYVRKDRVGEAAFNLFKRYDIGDIVGVSGVLFRTRTGELTVMAEEVELVTKSLRPLPEKFHGLKDVETRYRRRYLDLMVNLEVRELFLKRIRIIQTVRDYLAARGFLEVETPMMQTIPGGATAKPFATHLKTLDMDLFLRIAPELHLKRLLVGGFDRVFEINRSFRNEGLSTKHNPEFTMLEFYMAYADFHDLMALTEDMIARVAEEVLGGLRFTYQGDEIDLSPPWRRIRLKESLVEVGGLDPKEFEEFGSLKRTARRLGVDPEEMEGPGKLLEKLFKVLVEPKLIQPTFVHSYPVEVSPLARRSETDPDLVDRFELFIGGRELANGFSELNDPDDQRARFEEQVRAKAAGDEEAHPMDEDYVLALEYGMPPAAGEGVGIDRLAMLFTDSASIREVILFPLMRPEA